MAAIGDGSLDDEYVLDGSSSVNPGGRVLVHSWEVEAPVGDGCEGSIDDDTAAATVFQPSCRGTHRAALELSLVDGSETSTAEVTFDVNNRAPVLSGLAQESAFLPGVDVVISAEVADDDGDDTTCTARLAADNVGSPTGLVIPSEPASDCRFVISTPNRVETWKVEVVADDGFVESAPATIDLTPGNDPPVIEEVGLSESEAGYACVDGSCEAAVVRVTIDATDDSDAFEALGIVLSDVSVDPPSDVEVEILPVEGEHGVFDVRVHRADLGALAGTYTLEAQVTEVTSEGDPSTVTQQASFEVVGGAPVISSVSADDVGHTYSQAQGKYLATLTVQVEASDPENNTLLTAIELVSCPTVAAGEPACGGATLDIEETEAAGELVLSLSSTDLALLVGDYSFRAVVTDADGHSALEEPVAAVLNVAPTIDPGFVNTVQQSYTNGSHRAAVPLVTELDGDPMTYTLEVRCPGEGSDRSLPATCAANQSVAVSAAGELSVTGPASAGFLGGYHVTGEVTDGLGTLVVDVTLTVANTAPTLPPPASLESTCNHKTEASLVSSETETCFSFNRTASDANGDPLSVEVSLTGSGYALDGTPPTAPAANGAVAFSYGLETTYTTFKNTFASQPQRVIVRVRDPFGQASPDIALFPRLLNRAPVVSSKAWRNAAGTAAPPSLHNNEYDGTAFSARARYAASFSAGSPYDFALDLDVVDPDGDPLQVGLSVSCDSPVTDFDGGSITTLRALPSGGLLPLRMSGLIGECSGTVVRYREWALSSRFFCTTFDDCTLINSFGCTLSGANSQLTDGLTTVDLGASLSLSIPLSNTSDPLSCG